MKGTEYILRALMTEGIEHLFLVPGGLIDPFLPAFSDVPQIRPIIAAQEGGAAYMADGYARASGRFGACLAIGGPGLTNMTTAVSAAQSDGSPVLVMSGEISTSMEGLGEFQDASAGTFNDTEVFENLTAASFSVENPRLLNRDFQKALATLLTSPHQPVHISFPQDTLQFETDAVHEPLSDALRHSHPLDAESADRTWEKILPGDGSDQPSERIILYAGAGVEHSDGARTLVELAERFNLPVATTLRAKGVFPEDHPLSLGVFGYAGTRHATEAMLSDSLELLIVLGSGLNERDTMHWSARLAPKRGLVQVNLSPQSLGKVYPASVGVIGDAAAYLKRLLQAKPEYLATLEQGKEARLSWLKEIRKSPRFYDEQNTRSDAVPIHPARVIADLRRATPRNTVLLIDSGAHRAFAGHYWQSYEPRHYLSATSLGPMGWGIPAAIGAKVARPDRPCVLITGDGCMLMHGLEIHSAARHGIPVVFVVINNSAYGNVWLRASKMGPGPDELTSLPDHDWAQLARALGLQALTVERPAELVPAFEKALAANAPFLIDVKADKHYPTPVEPFQAEAKAWSYHE